MGNRLYTIHTISIYLFVRTTKLKKIMLGM